MGTYCYDGETYESIKELSSGVGVPYHILVSRLRKGIPLKEAVETSKTSNGGLIIEYNGKKYKSIRQLAKQFDICYTTLHRRITGGMPVDISVGIGLDERSTYKKAEPFVDSDGNIVNVRKLCRERGMSRKELTTVYNRLRRGKTLDEALNEPLIKGKSVFYKGKNYETVISLLRELGLENRSTYVYAQLSKGFSIDDIITGISKHKRDCKVEFEGVVYKSKKALCEAEGISYSGFLDRLSSGCSLEEAVYKSSGCCELKDYCESGGIEFEGVLYDSKKALCKAKGIDYDRFLRRLKKGLSLEEAIASSDKDKDAVYESVVYNGKCYSSLTSLANSVGMSPATLISRVKSGRSLKDAVETPVLPNKLLKVDFEDKTYRSLSSLCKSLGINAGSVQQEMRRKGVSAEEAVKAVLYRKENDDKCFTYEGKRYKSLRVFCEQNNLSYSLIKSRIRSGLSLDDAIRFNKFYGKTITYNGVSYNNLVELCRKLNLNYNLISGRLYKGLTLEEALNYRRPESFEYDGVVYDSLRDFCTRKNLPYGTIRSRVQSGLSVRDAVSFRRCEPISVDGKVYQSLTQALNSLGICNKSVNAVKMNYDLSIEDAILVCMIRKLNRENNNIVNFTVEDGLLNCSCSKCNQHMLLTPQLALDHLRDCIKEV